MFNYLFLYTALKLTFDYLINNYYLFNEHIYNSYAKKILINTFINDYYIVCWDSVTGEAGPLP